MFSGVLIVCVCTYTSIYNTSKFFKNVNFKKGIGIKRYTQFTTVTLIMKKVPKQNELVNLLRTITS